MSPRSTEFLVEARGRLGAARLSLDGGFSSAAVSLAYYAMLNAARAALSEEDRYAKTHSGTWTVFREAFVATQRFDADLVKGAEETFQTRLDTDYEARHMTEREAVETVDLAARFVAAIEALYPD